MLLIEIFLRCFRMSVFLQTGRYAMTIGENIRRLRKVRGLTLKELGDMIGVSESYIRAYESGRRNPKPASLQTLADALGVNVEVLKNSEVNGVSAMHQLFQMYRNFGGALFETKDDDGNDCVAIRFNSLMLMQSWFQRYKKYEEDVQKADKIKNVKERKEALEKAYREFDWWMDIYPVTDPYPQLVEAQKKHDAIMDQIGLNPKNSD